MGVCAYHLLPLYSPVHAAKYIWDASFVSFHCTACDTCCFRQVLAVVSSAMALVVSSISHSLLRRHSGSQRSTDVRNLVVDTQRPDLVVMCIRRCEQKLG